MAFLSFTATGQRWSTTKGWFTPPLGRDRLSISVLGALSNGTVLTLSRRVRADVTGSAGTEVPVLAINSAFIAARGATGFSEDFSLFNPIFEYDLTCTTFRSGDVVSGEIL